MIRPKLLTTLIAASLLVLLAAPPASAQDPSRKPLSPRERAYVEQLQRRYGPMRAERLQFPAERADEVRDLSPESVAPPPSADGPIVSEPPSTRNPIARPSPARPWQPAPPTEMVNGLQVLGRDVAFQRYKFPSAEAAQAQVKEIIDTPMPEGRKPIAAEVRGDQVLIVVGDLARDPAAVRKALDAGWRGLPAPAEPDATVAILGPRDMAVSTTLKDGPLRESIDQALAKARERQGTAEFQATPDGGMQVRAPSGFEADLMSDEHGASALLRSGPQGPATNEYLALLDPNADARSANQVRDANAAASEGAANVLDGLFGN